MGRIDYLARRHSNPITEYGLFRRTEMVIQQLRWLSLPRPYTLFDVGTADGQMLGRVLKHRGLNPCMAVGADVSFHYLRVAKAAIPRVFQADGRRLPLCADCVDVVLCTSVLKHIRHLDYMITEFHRVLKPAGKVIAVDPTPLGVRLGCRLGYFSRKGIVQALDLEATQCNLLACGFKVLNAERFMLSPVPMRGCEAIERMLKRLHQDRLFLYQVVCAECDSSDQVKTPSRANTRS